MVRKVGIERFALLKESCFRWFIFVAMSIWVSLVLSPSNSEESKTSSLDTYEGSKDSSAAGRFGRGLDIASRNLWLSSCSSLPAFLIWSWPCLLHANHNHISRRAQPLLLGLQVKTTKWKMTRNICHCFCSACGIVEVSFIPLWVNVIGSMSMTSKL